MHPKKAKQTHRLQKEKGYRNLMIAFACASSFFTGSALADVFHLDTYKEDIIKNEVWFQTHHQGGLSSEDAFASATKHFKDQRYWSLMRLVAAGCFLGSFLPPAKNLTKEINKQEQELHLP